MDLSVPALADRRVRLALGYASNRPSMVKTALYGLGRPASVPWPRQSLAYHEAQDRTYTYDLAKARQVLDAAGWDANNVIPLTIPSSLALAEPMALIFQADLASIAVRVARRVADHADHPTPLRSREEEIHMPDTTAVEDLQQPGALELLHSPDPARVAYTGTDGYPRVIPIGFLWNGTALVVCTAPTAPRSPRWRNNHTLR